MVNFIIASALAISAAIFVTFSLTALCNTDKTENNSTPEERNFNKNMTIIVTVVAIIEIIGLATFITNYY